MSDDTLQSGTYESVAQIGVSPSAVVKRWTLELSLADKEERDWRKAGERIYERYRGAKQKKNSFNILWSNTETLRQAVYNTLPAADVRRRFRDADPVGKVVSEVLERCADYAMDVYDFDHVIKMDLLDMLLPGRGVSRVKYVPDLEDMAPDATQETADDEKSEEAEAQQRIAYERVMCEHVNWQDFRRGPGKTWDEVRWVAFRHKFSKAGGVEQFGDAFEDVPLDECADEEVRKSDKSTGDLFKTADVWEIWNKDDKQIIFIAPAYKDRPLFPIDNPDGADQLKLDGFFPIPRPLYAIEDGESQVPTPLFELYKQQAEELDRVTSRINNLTEALKVRGVYNSILKEIEQLQNLGDNQLLAATNVQALMESGGLEKHIWYMPIQQAAEVIEILTRQREATKQVIYELTGISDIMRAATDPGETFGAQKIKAQWGTQRLKKMQAECQRYIRDIIRLKCQIIANKFQPQTIVEMTGLKLLNTEAERQQIQAQAQAFEQYQRAQQQAQQGGPPNGQAPQQPGQAPGFFMGAQPPQPPAQEQMELLNKPSWEQVIGLLKDNVHRNYHIDIETDSTIASSMESDMQGLQQVLAGVTQFLAGMGPVVQSGALPIEAVKEILMTITRRARMGMAVEDALDKMQQPKPPADPNAGKAQAEQQKAQIAAQLETQKMQMEAQLEERAKQLDLQLERQRLAMEDRHEQMRQQREMELQAHEQNVQAQQNAHQNELEAQREQMRAQSEAAIEQMRMVLEERLASLERATTLQKAQMDNATKIEVAEIGAHSKVEAAAAKPDAPTNAGNPGDR